MNRTPARPTLFSVSPIWRVIIPAAFLATNAVAQDDDATVRETLEAREAVIEALESDPQAAQLINDELGRGTPRGTFAGFSAASRRGDLEQAARFLDLSRLPAAEREQAGPRLAWQIRTIFDQVYGADGLLEIVANLDSTPQGHLNDGFPAAYEVIARIPSERGEVLYLLERVTGDDGTPIWLLSSTTIATIPTLWSEYGYRGLSEVLPAFLFETPVPHLIQPWQWIGLIVLAVIAAVLGWLLARIVRAGLQRPRSGFAQKLARFGSGPIGLLAGLWIFSASVSALRLAVDSRRYVEGAEQLVLAVALTWVAVRIAGVLFGLLERRVLRRKPSFATMMLPMLERVAQGLIIAIAAITLLDSLGFNVTALVAGLGVGGLAVALAAQKSIENLIGGITLYADQPIRVGDLCRFGGVKGTVESIGLRSTRIRTYDRSVVSVPNAEFATLHLENLTRRDRFWYHPTLALRYETTPDQLRYILIEVRKLLYSHPRVLNDEARIRFKEFGDYSLNLEIYAYVVASTYPHFLEVAEDLNLRIMDIVEEVGSRFAIPSQTTYLEEGSPLPPEAAEEASSRVKEWREKDELFLPDFPHEAIDALRGTVEYPPQGSPDAANAKSAEPGRSTGRYKDVR